MILGISGIKGSGKNTVARILEEYYGYELISFASPLKDAVSRLYSWDRELLEGETDESRLWRENVDIYWTTKLERKVTPRIILQEVGDIFRTVNKDFFILNLEQRLVKEKKYVITDLRGKNEFDWLKRRGGKSIKVLRDTSSIESSDTHWTEIEVHTLKSDIIIYNNSNLEDLERNVLSLNL